MSYNFKKLNTKVLSFDPVDDIDKIIFNHYIMRKENKNRITKKLEDGQFKMTIRSVSSDLNFSRGKVERLIKCFEELDIIRVVFKGNSSSKYSIYEYVTQDKNDDNKFKNLSETVIKIVDESVNETVICKNEKLSKPNNINDCNYNFNERHLDKFETVDETIGETDNKNSKIDNINIYLNNNIYNSVIDYLNKKAKKRFKSNTPKTKRLINTRLKEGFEEEDFYNVIDVKSAQWLDTDMEKFLRPETLFSNKFEGYLNEFVSEDRKLKESNIIEEKGYWDIQFDF